MDVNTAQEQFLTVVNVVKERTFIKKDLEWVRCSYRDMSAEFNIPYNSVKTIACMLRTDQHIDYRYIKTESRFKPIQYKYVDDVSVNKLLNEKYPILSSVEFNWILSKLSREQIV